MRPITIPIRAVRFKEQCYRKDLAYAYAQHPARRYFSTPSSDNELEFK